MESRITDPGRQDVPNPDMPNPSELWRYKTEVLDDGQSIIGFDVEARDGHIGKVDESTTEIDRASIVVDTGFWIFGKKRQIPAGLVDQINFEDRKVFIRMTKDGLRAAPEYLDDRSHPDFARAEPYEAYYQPLL